MKGKPEGVGNGVSESDTSKNVQNFGGLPSKILNRTLGLTW